MFRNYFLIALRSYGKNYLFTLINIVGMAVGLAGVIFTFLLFDYESGFDKSHKNTENIYRVNCNRIIEGAEQKWGVVPSALGPIAADTYQSIKSFTRYGNTSAFLVQYGDVIHREQITFADPNFFDLFSFDLKSGQKEIFKNKSSVIISEQFAKKYFGNADPMGKQLTVRKNDQIIDQFIVGAVTEKIPMNSSFHFDIITQYDNLLDSYHTKEFDWKATFRPVLYIELSPSASVPEAEKELQKFAAVNNEPVNSWQIRDFYLVPFSKQKNEARFVRSFTTAAGLPISALYGSIIMNGLILLVACFNFTNTSLAYANKRLREIGIRRTFGGIRMQIIKQFFIENFILCLLALILSIEMANTWVGMMNAQWPIDINTFYFDDWSITVNLVLLLIAVSVIAGAYPAFYVSRFHPTEILKGKLKLKGNNYLSRVLLTWQFGFSIMAIFSGIVLTQNARFQKTLDWGFDKENAIVIPLQDEGNYTVLKNALADVESIQKISGTVHNFGFGSEVTEIEINGKPHTSELLKVGDNYLHTIGCKVLEGRNFLDNSENDIRESILVNAEFVRTFDIKRALEQTVFINNRQYHIVGVIQDFMPYGLFNPVKPSVVRVVSEDEYTNLVVRANAEKLPEIMNISQTKWKNQFPDKPFEGFFMEDVAAEALHTNNGIMVQFGILAVFALFLSVTGLYSIVSLTVNKRIKEIGIRKVMGASVRSVMQLLNYEFSIIILLATIIGCIGGYFFMDKFLSDIFVYHQKIGPFSFAAAAIIIFTLTALTSGIKIYKVASDNPTKALRDE